MARVKVDPPPFKDQITDGDGNITPEFHDFLYRLWQRTGGDSDVFDFLSKLQTNRVYQQQLEPAVNSGAAAQIFQMLQFRSPVDVSRIDKLEKEVAQFEQSNVPVGGIIMFSGATIPDGWFLCDGANGTPDLRDKFVVGSGTTYAVGDTGGAAEHTTTRSGAATGGDVQAVTDQTIPILPPYYALAYIMKAEEIA